MPDQRTLTATTAARVEAPDADTVEVTRAARTARLASTWLVPLLVALAAVAVNSRVPLASALIVALVVGAVVANTRLAAAPAVRGSVGPAKFLLRLGIAFLGFRLALSEIADLGMFGVLLIIGTVACTFYLTQFVGRRMGLEPELVSLVASGFSVCGAAAIAGVQDSIRAGQKAVALALALVTVHGTVMLAVIPLLGDLFGMDDTSVAMWAGASIHEVAQVAAAATLIGPGVLAVAMAVKLGRVLMLAPVHHAVAHLHHGGRGSLLREIPWFLIAFVAAVLVRAAGFLPEQTYDVATWASNLFLAAGMFGLGLGLVLRDLWPLPWKVVALSVVATFTVTATPLVMLALR